MLRSQTKNFQKEVFCNLLREWESNPPIKVMSLACTPVHHPACDISYSTTFIKQTQINKGPANADWIKKGKRVVIKELILYSENNL